MSLNDSIRYVDNRLFIDNVPLLNITHEIETPFYLYSLQRALGNYHRIRDAYAPLNPHIHFSAKSNGTMAILKALVAAGAGIDAVSGGEIYKAIEAGCDPQNIVFAGVGKTMNDIRYALKVGVGWFNLENVDEARIIQEQAVALGKADVRVAVRYNPDVAANTHPSIATGHAYAKFGLTADAIRGLFATQNRYPSLSFQGIHVHIGSNLRDTHGSQAAIERALELIAPYEHMRTLNIGGGMPVAYGENEDLPTFQAFADALTPLLRGYEVILEPGRAIIADAGILITKVLYQKEQGGQRLVIVDASMTELIRPMLYDATHMIVAAHRDDEDILSPVQIHGPVCESTDVLARDVLMPPLDTGDLLAILTAGAYGSVMSSNYNARPRPTEVLVSADSTWGVIRKRETWSDLLRQEIY